MASSPIRVLAKVDQKQIDGIISGLRYVSSIPLARSAFNIDKIKAKLLRYLLEIFPKSDPRWGRALHLITGFRAYDIPETSSTTGFTIQHQAIKSNERIREILASLEGGSRGYYQSPKKPLPFGLGLFSFPVGRGGEPEFAMKRRLHIPAREGGYYMERTYDLAKQLVEEAKPEFFRKIKQEFKKR